MKRVNCFTSSLNTRLSNVQKLLLYAFFIGLSNNVFAGGNGNLCVRGASSIDVSRELDNGNIYGHGRKSSPIVPNSAARGGPYVYFGYGTSEFSSKIDYDTGLKTKKPQPKSAFLSLAAGYSVNKNFRAELNYLHFIRFKYREEGNSPYALGAYDSYKQSLKAQALFANAYFVLDRFNKFKPYVSMGIGFSCNKTSNLTATFSNAWGIFKNDVIERTKQYNIAWNIGIGMSCRLNKHFTWDVLNYRHYNLGTFKTKDPESNDGWLKAQASFNTFSTGIVVKF